MEVIVWVLLTYLVLGAWWVDAVGRQQGFSNGRSMWLAVGVVVLAPIWVPLFILASAVPSGKGVNPAITFLVILGMALLPLVVDVVGLFRRVVDVSGLAPYFEGLVERVRAPPPELDFNYEGFSGVPKRWRK